MIKQLKFISIPVRDQDRALAFYTEKLGFRVTTDQPLGNQRWIELQIPGAQTGVVLFTPEGHESRVGTFLNASFTCDSVEKTFAELAAKGVAFDGEPAKQPWGTFVKMRDSEGNQLLLSSS